MVLSTPLNGERLSRKRLPFSCTGPLNGIGTFRRRSAPPSTPFTAAPSPSGLALPAALIHAAHLLKKHQTATLRESLQLPHKCKLSNVWSSATGKKRRWLFFLIVRARWCRRHRRRFLSRVRLGEASTDGGMDDGRMLCRKMGWGSPTRRSRSLLSHPLRPHLCLSLSLSMKSDTLLVFRGAIAVRSGPPARRDSGAPRDATPKHLHEGS